MPKPFSCIPGPKPLPILGSVLDYSRWGKFSFDRLHQAKLERFREYGKIYKEKMGPITFVHVFNPSDIATTFYHEGSCPVRPPLPLTVTANKRDNMPLGLGSSNGAEWHKVRTHLNRPMMHPRAADAYLAIQNEVADDFLSLLKMKIGHKNEIDDMLPEIQKYTMESIGTVCFNTRLGCLGTELSRDSEAFQVIDATTAVFDAVQRTMFSFPWYQLYPTPIYKQFMEGRRTYNRIAHKHVKSALDRIKNNPNENSSDSPNLLNTLLTTTELSMEHILGNLTELFTAGIDSTANALSFAIYHLARHKEKQEKLYQEIRKVLDPGEPVTPEAISNLPYLKACVKESFRLSFPTEGGTARILPVDVTLSGYDVPKGTLIYTNNQTICLEEEYFERATEFLPERWMRDGSATTRPPSRFVMLPFGYGPRMCIGRRFAEQEIYLALIKIISSFILEYHYEDIGMVNRLFTTPDKPIRLTMELRPDTQ